MYNKKVLIDSLKKLGSAKAPTQKKDIIVGSNNPAQMLSMKKGGSSVDKKLSVKKSNIQGKGLFIDQPIRKGEIIGLAHLNNQASPVVGKYHNHSEDSPTAVNISKGNKRYLVAARDLPAGTEITTNYRLQPELEQPEDFMQKGGMTPQKDGYRTYSPFKNLPFIDVETDTIDTDNIIYDLQLRANNGVTKNVQKNTGLHKIPGATVIREIPMGRKGGSAPKLPRKKNSKGYSRSLEATNRLFAEHPFFAQPKSRKNKIYDPNAKYYQDGGEPKYNNLPTTYLTALQNFVYPNVKDDPERTGYNSVNNTINYDSQSPIENMDNKWWMEHELFHDLQNQAGGMSTSGVVGQRPNPYAASDESMQGYYDRRDADVERTIDSMIAQDPNLQFIPRNKLAEGAGPGFIGAEDLQYADPTTLEGEAREYEQYIREGNPSIFPNRKYGGLTQYAPGGASADPPDWLTKKGANIYFNPTYMNNFTGGTNSYEKNMLGSYRTGFSPVIGIEGSLSKSRRADEEKGRGWLYNAYAGLNPNAMKEGNYTPSAGLSFDFENSPQDRVFRPFAQIGADYNPDTGLNAGATTGARFPFTPYGNKRIKPGYAIGHLDIYGGIRGGYGKMKADGAGPSGGLAYGARVHGKYMPERKSVLGKLMGKGAYFYGDAGIQFDPQKGQLGQKMKDYTIPSGAVDYYGNSATASGSDQDSGLKFGNTIYANVGVKKELDDIKFKKDDRARKIQEIEDNEKRAFQENEIKEVIEKPKKECPEGEERHCADCPCEPIERVSHPRWLQEGGELPEDYSEFESFSQTLPSNLQDPDFEYGNPDQYNLYGMWETAGKPGSFSDVQDGEYFPLQDDGTYHGFTVGSDGEFLKPMSHGTTWKEVMNAHLNTDPYFQQNRIIKNEEGRLQYVPNEDEEYIETELTPEEIEQYAKGGYIIEDISIPSLNKKQLGGLIKSGKNLLRGANIATLGTANTLAKNLAPVMINPARIPLLGATIDKVGPFTGSPLNVLPGYGETMLSLPDTAFRKFGDTLDYVKMSGELNPAHGPLLRMGKNQIASEGNWAELNEPNEQYQGVFGARFDFNNPGTNLGYTKMRDRNGVLITDAQGNPLPNIPISDPGLSFHRRLPFSNRYIDVDMDKLRNNEFDWRTVGGNAQSLLERYGYAAGYAGLLGAMGLAAPQEYIDEYINEPIMKGYNKYIKPGAQSVYDFWKPKQYRQTEYGTLEEYSKGGSIPKAQLGKIIKSTKNIVFPPTPDQRFLTDYVSNNFGPHVTSQHSADIARRLAREQYQRAVLDAQQAALFNASNIDISTLPQQRVADLQNLVTPAIQSKINKVNLHEAEDLLKTLDPSELDKYIDYRPFRIYTPSGSLALHQNTDNLKDNLFSFNVFMNKPREAGLAFNYANKFFPYKNPSILEKNSLSLDSFNMLTNMGRRPEWDIQFDDMIDMNALARHSKLFEGLPSVGRIGAGHFDKATGEEMLRRLNAMIAEKGFSEKADWQYTPISGDNLGIHKFMLPNYKITRKYSEGGDFEYELGDEVDETTMQELEKLGYTFEQI